jgi:YD repeat-containing protein
MNNLKSAIIILVLSLVASLTACSQGYKGNDDYIPPSPNAFGLMSAVNTSVNLYTGSADINLPLTSIAGRQLSVPISLNYNASGVKVQDIPGWVGTGWTLEAGGVITRVVRGLPDEEANGFCGVNNIGEKANEAINEIYLTKVSAQEWDSEPDLFYFNFLGKKGKFILDETGSPVLLPYANLKISPAICSSNGSWVIIDENGVKYTFGMGETTSYKVRDESDKSFVSSWYLTEIRTPGDEDIITLTYHPLTPNITYSYYVQELVRKVWQTSLYNGANCGLYDPTTKNKDLAITVVNPVYLKSISSSLGKVNFYLGERSDLFSGMRLNQFTIENSDGLIVNSFNLGYGYFNSDGCNGGINCDRLKLDAVFKSGDDIHQKLYSFQYNDLNLPPRYSHSIDHWGYYNSNSYSSKIPSVQDDNQPCPGSYYPGADRSTDTTRCKASILTKVYDAKGGYTEFIYSVHQYSDDGTNNKFAGGVRIRILNRCTGDGDCSAIYYYYKKFNTNISSGSIAALPIYHFRAVSSHFQAMSPVSGFWVTSDYLVITSNSLKDLFNVDGYHVGYGQVTEKVQGLGYTQITFTNDQSNPDTPPQQFSYRNGDFVGNLSRSTFPYTPNTTKSFERGLVLQKDYYNQDNNIVKKELFSYNLSDPSEIKNVKAIRVGKRGSDPVYSFYWIGEYRHISKPYVLNSTSVTIYDQQSPGIPGDNQSKKVSQSTEYSYIQVDPAGTSTISLDLLPRKITQVFPTGEKLITENKYIKDYSFTGVPVQNDSRGLYYMQQKHMDNALIESISYLERYENNSPVKYLVSGVVNRYKEFPALSQKVYQWDSRKLKASGSASFTTYAWSKMVGQEFTYSPTNFRLLSTAGNYDSFGNLLSSTGSDGISNVMTYGNNNTLIASTTRNAGTYQHQILYEHKPLIGLVTLTDANQNTTKYEYNTFNELKLIRDEAGNIAERYSSNVKNQLPAPTPTTLNLSVSGTQTVNNTLTFTLNALVSDFGSTTYKWEFGDGTSAASTPTTIATITKSYSQAGTYRVMVTATNSRYGIAKAIKTIVVQ